MSTGLVSASTRATPTQPERISSDVVDRVKAITGRIDLVHANGSRDPFGSGADRHANFEDGDIDPALIVEVVRQAGVPVVCETPNGAAGQGADIAYLRKHLSADA